MPAPDLVPILVDLPDVADIDPNPDVGVVYEVGVDGRGYMLADAPGGEFQYRRGTLNLDPERLATTETPFSQSLDRYSFYSQATWEGGVGQRWGNRVTSDEAMVYRSSGVDLFAERGTVRLLRTQAEFRTGGAMVAAVGSALLVHTGTNAFDWYNGSSWSSFTIAAAGTVVDITSDGTNWYATDGTDIWKGSAGSDPGAAWSTVNADEILWSAGRLMAGVSDGTFTTITAAGTEEVTSGHFNAAPYDGPAGTPHLGGVVAGFFYFGYGRQVYAWQLGVDSAGAQFVPFEAAELPEGEEVRAVGVGGGSTWIRSRTDAGLERVWRGLPNADGGLTLVLVTDWDGPEQDAGFAEYGDLIFFPYLDGGLGAVSLVSGGWSPWVTSGASDAPVDDVAIYDGYPVFVVDDSGTDVWYDDGDFVTSGYVDLSIEDGGSALDKVWDEVTLVMDSLPSGSSVAVSYSIDGGGSYTALATISSAGQTGQTIPLGIKSPTLGLRLTLAGTGSRTTVRVAQVKYHALGISDTVLILPIHLSDNLAGLNGAELPEAIDGWAVAEVRRLLALTQKRVLVQDIDWVVTRQSEIFEVLQADVRREGLRGGRSKGPHGRWVVTLTLRKVGVSS